MISREQDWLSLKRHCGSVHPFGFIATIARSAQTGRAIANRLILETIGPDYLTASAHTCWAKIVSDF